MRFAFFACVAAALHALSAVADTALYVGTSAPPECTTGDCSFHLPEAWSIVETGGLGPPTPEDDAFFRGSGASAPLWSVLRRLHHGNRRPHTRYVC